MSFTDKLLQVSDKKFYSKSASDVSKSFSGNDIKEIDGVAFLEIPLTSTIDQIKVFDVNQENQTKVTDLSSSPVTFVKLNTILMPETDSSDESSEQEISSEESEAQISLDFSGRYFVGDDVVYFTPDDLLKLGDEYLLKTNTNGFVSKIYILNGTVPAHNTLDVSEVSKKILININNIDTQDVINGGKIVKNGTEVSITYNANIFTMNSMRYLMLDYNQKDYDCYFYDNNNELIHYDLNREGDKLAIAYNATTMSFNSEYGVYIDDGILRQIIKQTTSIKGTNYLVFNDVEDFNDRLYILQESGENSFTEHFVTSDDNKTFIDISGSSFDFSNGGMVYLGFALDNEVSKWIVRKMLVYKNYSSKDNDFSGIDYKPCLSKIELFMQNAKDYSDDYYNVHYVTNIRNGVYWREPTKNLVNEYGYLNNGEFYTPAGAIEKAHELYGDVFHITGSYYDAEAKEWKLNNYHVECKVNGDFCHWYKLREYYFCGNGKWGYREIDQILENHPTDGVIVYPVDTWDVEKILYANGIWVTKLTKNGEEYILQNGKVYFFIKNGLCEDLEHEVEMSSEESSEYESSQESSEESSEEEEPIKGLVCSGGGSPYYIDPNPPIPTVPWVDPVPPDPEPTPLLPDPWHLEMRPRYAIIQQTKMCQNCELVSKYELVDLTIYYWVSSSGKMFGSTTSSFSPNRYYKNNSHTLVKVKQQDGSYSCSAVQPFTQQVVSVVTVQPQNLQAFMNYFEDNYNTTYPDCKEKKPPTGCQSVYAGTTNSSKGKPTIDLSGFQNIYSFMSSGNTSGYDEAHGKDSKISYKGCTWRLYEKGYNLTYGTGTIDTNGNLVGLPSSFTANNGYDGNMYIEICCS